MRVTASAALLRLSAGGAGDTHESLSGRQKVRTLIHGVTGTQQCQAWPTQYRGQMTLHVTAMTSKGDQRHVKDVERGEKDLLH